MQSLHISQARFLSRFTRASSGEKSTSSPKTSAHGASTRAAAAAGTAVRDVEAAAAAADAAADDGDGDGDGEQPSRIELAEVDPSQLDHPEGAVGADAPDPEDADPPAVRLMRSEQETKATAEADGIAEAPDQPGPRTSAEQPDKPVGRAKQRGGGGKQGRLPARKRRGAAVAAAGPRLTRARAGAAVSANEAAVAGAQPRADASRTGSRRRRPIAVSESAATASAASAEEGMPAASSDCILLDEAPDASPAQLGDAESTAPMRAEALPGTTSQGNAQEKVIGEANAEAAQQHGAAAGCQSPGASDSEHSSAMAVTPHLRADQEVNSSPVIDPVAVRGGSDGREAADPDPAAVQQV